MNENTKCWLCDATDNQVQLPTIEQDGKPVRIGYGAYPSLARWGTIDNKPACVRCASAVDRGKMLQGLHGGLGYTQGPAGEPLEICNDTMTMYWEVRYLVAGKHPQYWRAEFIHDGAVWWATCHNGRAVARKAFDLPIDTPQEIIFDLEIDGTGLWVTEKYRGRK
jgi:hypothetical protein